MADEFGWGALAGIALGALATYITTAVFDHRQQRRDTYYWLLGATRSLPQLHQAYLESLTQTYATMRLGKIREGQNNAVWAERYFQEARYARERADSLLVPIVEMNHDLLGHISRAERLFPVTKEFHDARRGILEVVRGQLGLNDEALATLAASTDEAWLLRQANRAGRLAGESVDEQMATPLRRLVEALGPGAPGGWARDFSS